MFEILSQFLRRFALATLGMIATTAHANMVEEYVEGLRNIESDVRYALSRCVVNSTGTLRVLFDCPRIATSLDQSTQGLSTTINSELLATFLWLDLSSERSRSAFETKLNDRLKILGLNSGDFIDDEQLTEIELLQIYVAWVEFALDYWGHDLEELTIESWDFRRADNLLENIGLTVENYPSFIAAPQFGFNKFRKLLAASEAEYFDEARRQVQLKLGTDHLADKAPFDEKLGISEVRVALKRCISKAPDSLTVLVGCAEVATNGNRANTNGIHLGPEWTFFHLFDFLNLPESFHRLDKIGAIKAQFVGSEFIWENITEDRILGFDELLQLLAVSSISFITSAGIDYEKWQPSEAASEAAERALSKFQIDREAYAEMQISSRMDYGSFRKALAATNVLYEFDSGKKKIEAIQKLEIDECIALSNDALQVVFSCFVEVSSSFRKRKDGFGIQEDWNWILYLPTFDFGAQADSLPAIQAATSEQFSAVGINWDNVAADGVISDVELLQKLMMEVLRQLPEDQYSVYQPAVKDGSAARSVLKYLNITEANFGTLMMSQSMNWREFQKLLAATNAAYTGYANNLVEELITEAK